MSIMVYNQVFFMSRMMRMVLTMTREKVGVCFSFRSLSKFSVPLNTLLKVREERSYRRESKVGRGWIWYLRIGRTMRKIS